MGLLSSNSFSHFSFWPLNLAALSTVHCPLLTVLKVLLNHSLPCRPIVRIPRVPDVELVRNVFETHDAIEVLILSEALVVPPRCEDVGVAPIVIEEPPIAKVGQEVRRQIVIDVLVVVTAQ